MSVLSFDLQWRMWWRFQFTPMFPVVVNKANNQEGRYLKTNEKFSMESVTAQFSGSSLDWDRVRYEYFLVLTCHQSELATCPLANLPLTYSQRDGFLFMGPNDSPEIELRADRFGLKTENDLTVLIVARGMLSRTVR